MSCPINTLHADAGWNIMKYLEYPDYRNLAFTCRKWFLIASSAANSVKPKLVSKKLHAPQQDEYESLDRKYRLLNNKNVSLFKSIECDKLYVNNLTSPSFLKFICKNNPEFDLLSIKVELPISSEDIFESLCYLSNKVTAVELKCLPRQDSESSVECLFDIYKFYKNSLDCTLMNCFDCTSLDPAKLVVQQWINHERPELETFYFSFRVPFTDILEHITEGSEDYIRRRFHRVVDDETAYGVEIVVPGLPLLVVHSYQMTVVMEFINGGWRDLESLSMFACVTTPW